MWTLKLDIGRSNLYIVGFDYLVICNRLCFKSNPYQILTSKGSTGFEDAVAVGADATSEDYGQRNGKCIVGLRTKSF